MAAKTASALKSDSTAKAAAPAPYAAEQTKSALRPEAELATSASCACTPLQIFLCAATLLCYGAVGLGSSLSGRAVDAESAGGWAVGLSVIAVGRTIGALLAAGCMLCGERRKSVRLIRQAMEEEGVAISISQRASSSRLASTQASLRSINRRPGCGCFSMDCIRALCPSSESQAQGAGVVVGFPGVAAAEQCVTSGTPRGGLRSPDVSHSRRRITRQISSFSLRVGQPAPPLSDLIILSATQILMAAGYVPFLFLSRTGDISFIAPIMTLHTLFPTVYGFCTGEAITTTKVLGVVGSFVAVGVLGADSMTGSGPGSIETLLLQLLLLLCSTVCWGSAEIIAVKFGRLVRAKHAVLSQLVGTGIVAAVSCATIVFHALAGNPAPIAPPQPPDVGGLLAGISALWLSVVVLGGHAMAGLGWLLYVRLGQLGDASQFAPVVQLYGLVSALFGIALAGEQVSLFKVIGMLISGLAIGLLGMSQSQKRSLMRRFGCGSCIPQQQEQKQHEEAQVKTALGASSSSQIAQAIRHFEGAKPVGYTSLALVPSPPPPDTGVFESSGSSRLAFQGEYTASATGASDPGRMLITASSAGSTSGIAEKTTPSHGALHLVSSAGSTSGVAEHTTPSHGALHLVSSAGSMTGLLTHRYDNHHHSSSNNQSNNHSLRRRDVVVLSTPGSSLPACDVELHETALGVGSASGNDTTHEWDSKAAERYDTTALAPVDLCAASASDPQPCSAVESTSHDAEPQVSDVTSLSDWTPKKSGLSRTQVATCHHETNDDDENIEAISSYDSKKKTTAAAVTPAVVQEPITAAILGHECDDGREGTGSVASEPLPESSHMQTDTPTIHIPESTHFEGAAAGLPPAVTTTVDTTLVATNTNPDLLVAPTLLPPYEIERAASVGAPEGLAERQESHPVIEALEGAVPTDLDQLRGGVEVLGGADAAIQGCGDGDDADAAVVSTERVGSQAPILAVGGPSDVPRVISEVGVANIPPAGSCLIPQGPFASHTEFIAADDAPGPNTA